MKLSIRTIFALFIILSPLPLFAAAAGGVVAKKTPDEQLAGQIKINRWTLFNSGNEQIRIDTAIELLKNPSKEARSILLEALAASDNPPAQTSVCKAIRQFRSWVQLVPDSTDFIAPLMKIIKTQHGEPAKLAAQASLIFSYKQVSSDLKDIIESNQLPAQARRNAIYALQIRPDKEAVSELINLLDSKDATVSSAASAALQEWLPLGNDRKLWLKVLKDLEKKSRSEILRERLLAQQDKTRQLTAEVERWKTKYIQSLETIYQNITDDSERAKFIAEKLASNDSRIHLWAIKKINMWRKSGKPLPLEILAGPLIKLLTDNSVQVREAGAELLGMLTNVNSADALLRQMKIETSAHARALELTALGRVCNYALSPGAEIDISPELRREALVAAADFLKTSDPIVASEAIGNLLMHNGMEPAQVKPYFSMMRDYYKNSDPNNRIKAAMLNEMSRLCSSNSFYRNIAGEVFKNIFNTEISSEDSSLAEPAVTGLSRVDPAGAFALMKQKGFTNHQSLKIRLQMIESAAALGTKDDLEWLSTIAVSGKTDDEKKLSLEAMIDILQNSSAKVTFEWAQKFMQIAQTSPGDIRQGKIQTLLEMAEKKAVSQKNTRLLSGIREAMAEYYKTADMYELSAKYYGILLQSSSEPNRQKIILNNLLQVHLSAEQPEQTKQLIANVLLSSDIGPDSLIAGTLSGYFESKGKTDVSREVLTALKSIKIKSGNPRPLWQKQLLVWGKTITPLPELSQPAKEPNKPQIPAKQDTEK